MIDDVFLFCAIYTHYPVLGKVQIKKANVLYLNIYPNSHIIFLEMSRDLIEEINPNSQWPYLIFRS